MPKRIMKMEDRVANAVVDWLTENEAGIQTIDVYTSDGRTIVVDIIMQSNYTVDDVDTLELECYLSERNEDDPFDPDDPVEYEYQITAYTKDDYDNRMNDGIVDDPDAMNDEDEDDDLHVIEPEEYGIDDDDDDDDDVELGAFDDIEVESYTPDQDDMLAAFDDIEVETYKTDQDDKPGERSELT